MGVSFLEGTLVGVAPAALRALWRAMALLTEEECQARASDGSMEV